MLEFKHRILAPADASHSVVLSSISPSLIAGTSATITVQANDANGVLTSGGDTYIIKISNRWTKINNYYCSLNSGSIPLTSNINGVMTDQSNGLYNYNLNVPYNRK